MKKQEMCWAVAGPNGLCFATFATDPLNAIALHVSCYSGRCKPFADGELDEAQQAEWTQRQQLGDRLVRAVIQEVATPPPIPGIGRPARQSPPPLPRLDKLLEQTTATRQDDRSGSDT